MLENTQYDLSTILQGEDKHLYDARSQMVVKANELIQKSRFNLSLQQQKIVLYLISQITPYDEDFRTYEFSINEFCKVCGIDESSGKNYLDLKTAIKDIADQSVWVTLPNGQETLLRWIEKPYINSNSGLVRIRLDEDMKPYLLQLKQNFTKYELIWTLSFRCKYSTRLYELIKSIHYNELETYERTYNLAELKRILGAESYNIYNAFKTRVLDPAIKEINEFSDKTLTYFPLKTGRAVDRIKFIIESKDGMETLSRRLELEEKYLTRSSRRSDDQMALWDFDEEEETVASSQ